MSKHVAQSSINWAAVGMGAYQLLLIVKLVMAGETPDISAVEMDNIVMFMGCVFVFCKRTFTYHKPLHWLKE